MPQKYEKCRLLFSSHPEKLFLSHNRLEICINNPLFNKLFRSALVQRLLRCDNPHHIGVAEQQIQVMGAEEDGLMLLTRELVHDVDQLDFARIVKEGGRLVHEDEGCVLYQGLAIITFCCSPSLKETKLRLTKWLMPTVSRLS